jgi:hypothetical protein
VSYFTRLREQSGLAIVNEPVAKDPDLSPPIVDLAADATELMEVVDTREVTSESSPTATDIVSLPPAPAGMAATSTTRRHDPEAKGQPSKPGPDDGSVTRRSASAEETSQRPGEDSNLASTRRSDSASAAPLSREATLRHVFEWLAAPAQPESREDVVTPRSESGRGTLVHPPPAMQTGAPSRSSSLPVRDRELPAPSIDMTNEDVVELSDSPRRAALSPARASEPASREQVAEILTVSIGAIHMRVEAQATAPVVAARTADPARPVRPERRERSRLPRHYLRP